MPPPDCPFCKHQNPADAKFCNECGSPLHLTPCGACGAVNNVTDAQCWRCGGVLFPLDSPVPVERAERKVAVPEQLSIELPPTKKLPTEQELEQELVALEQEVQTLERAPASAEAPPPVLEHAPRGSGIPGPKAADPRPRPAEQALRDSNIPELKSLFVPADDAPRGRRALIVTAVVVALGSAIAVGAYLLDRDRGSPQTAASATPPSQTLAEPARAPSAASNVAEVPAAAPEPAPRPAPNAVDAPIEQRSNDAGEAPAVPAAPVAPEPAPPPAPKAVDAPIERRVANDPGEAPAVPAAPVAPEPGCPPAVEAMALCEWLARADR